MKPFIISNRRIPAGQGLIEYALILSLVALVVIMILTVLGEQTALLFEDVACTLNSGENCQCKVNEQFLKYPSYSCAGGTFALQTLTTCRDNTSLSLLVSGWGEIGLSYNTDKQVFFVAMPDPGGLCTALKSGDSPSAYIVSRHAEDDTVRTLPFSFGGSGDDGGSTGGDGTDGDGSTGEIPTVNHAPVLSPIGDQSMVEGETLIVPITSSDSDGDSLTLSVWGTESFMAFSDHGDGTATLTLKPDFTEAGAYELLVVVHDGRGATDNETFTLTVENFGANHEPSLTAVDEQQVDEGTTEHISLDADDPDGDSLTFILSPLEDFMTFTADTMTLTVTPDFEDAGTYPFTVTVTDGSAEDSITFTITVVDVNRDPELVPIDPLILDEGELYTLDVTAVDPDDDPITLTATGLETFMTFVDNGDGTGILTLDLDYETSGSYTVIINANDDNGGNAYDTFTLTVNPVSVAQRVTDDLEVLYYFDGVSGSTIAADSGAAAPLTLNLSDTSAVSAIANGLQVHTPTHIGTASAATILSTHIKSANEITVEAWVKPDNLTQDGPARIVSLSLNGSYRNVSLNQDSSHYEVRLRTTTAGANGTIKRLQTDNGTVTTNLVHLMYTRAADGTATFYINGSAIESDTIDGNLSNWDTSDYPLVLANEYISEPITERDWLGDYYLVALYSRALTSAEVQQNYLAGGDWISGT